MNRDHTVRLVGGIKTQLAFGEFKAEKFGSASHVAVHYLTDRKTAPHGEFGWLPLSMWEGGQTIATTPTENFNVWHF